MKRRGPMWALVGVAAAGLVALSGSPSLAQEDIYENVTGLMGGGVVPAPGPVLSGFTIAGPRLNPNGIGQFLMGAYYDVRPVNGDAQINNIQLINTNTNNTALPPCDMTPALTSDYSRGVDGAGCYNPNGGILAKVRFRESKTSTEVLDFVIALSCGEVWAGKIDLNAGTNLPEIESRYPIVVQPFTAAGFPTVPAFDPNNGGAAQGFAPTGIGAGLTDEDLQRGHFEVIAMEALPCEPISGDFSLDGGDWLRLPAGPGQTPTNAIGGEIFLVRAAAAASHNYNLAAISNFVEQGGGSIVPLIGPFGDAQPDFSDCVASDINGVPYLPVQCVAQANLALSKSRVIAQYDVDPLTLATTDVIVTFPDKYENCGVTNGVWNGVKIHPTTPFQCLSSGEEVVCTVYDRQENFLQEKEGFISPSTEQAPCVLPREVNVIAISIGGGNGERGDLSFATGGLPAPESGWIDIDLVRNSGGAVIHRELYPDFQFPITHDILGVYLGGYRGLPTLALVLQEFQNPGAGRFYGNTVPALFEQVVLKAGQS